MQLQYVVRGACHLVGSSTIGRTEKMKEYGINNSWIGYLEHARSELCMGVAL